MITVFSDLYEDEVAEEIRSAGHHAEIRSGAYMWREANMQCDDGIYTSGNGLYVEYLNGRETYRVVSRAYLADILAHETFSITEG